jgi:murein DD-endopeptidase MepM/ murein hydrolase activator NlpD
MTQPLETLMPTIKEVNRLKEKLEKDGLKGLSDNWNNLAFAINQLVLKSGFSEQDKFIWPMVGRISSPYGEKRTNSKGQIYYHTGIDIADNPANKTPILAASDGKVIYAGNANDGYGNKIIIDHSGGLKTLYAHCSVLKVKSGEQVKQSQQIAIVGSTGHSTGPHLHFEVLKDDKVQNPLEYLQER